MPKKYYSRALVLTWLVVFLLISLNASVSATVASAKIYLLLVAILQSTFFVIPLAILCYLLNRPEKLWQQLTVHAFALILLALVFSNYKLHAMYNFFIDGFVINLLTTPGGVEALGLSPSFYISASISAVIIAIVYAITIRLAPLEFIAGWLPKVEHLTMIVFILFLTEASIYSYSYYTSGTSVLSVAAKIVWHIPVTSSGFFKKIGVNPLGDQQLVSATKVPSGNLSYPIVKHDYFKIDKPYNIVWLTAESLRHDMVNRKIMPNTFNFANSHNWFQSHYSGGNGTRLGMFSQFYGVYGTYWFDFLNTKTPPVLISALQRYGYAMKAITSARFTYPEFDKTIFSSFKPEQLQEYNQGAGWQRDKKNANDLVTFIEKNKSREKPFFAFMFFESAHANYYFPPDAVIEDDYLSDFDYLSTDIGANIDKIKNRYINASHYLDTRLGVVFDALKRNDLYDNTIVIVTGDHGEEFMEKGRWGHNSTFVQEQIRVPLAIHIPGQPPKIYTGMTSHLDVPATILSALGYDAPADTYSFGQDLFSADYQRSYTVAGDWHGNTLITPNVKYVLTLKGSMNSMKLSSLDDKAVNAEEVTETDRQKLGEFVRELPRFYAESQEYKNILYRNTNRNVASAKGLPSPLAASLAIRIVK